MSINHVIDWKPAFLAALREAPVVRHGCEAAGVDRSTAYRAREADPAFAEAWDQALETGIDRAEKEAVRRAVEGLHEPMTSGGAPIWMVERDPLTGHPVMVEEQYTTFDAEGAPVLRKRMVEKLVLDDRGQPIPHTVRKYSDPLLALILKGRRKAVYSERIEQTGANGGPLIPVDEGARAARAAALLALAAQRRADADDACDLC